MVKRRVRTTKGPTRGSGPRQPLESLDLHAVEFHRHGVALVPQGPGRAVFTILLSAGSSSEYCGCAEWRLRGRRCEHIARLHACYQALRNRAGGDLDAGFRASIWYELLVALGEDRNDPLRDVVVAAAEVDGTAAIRVLSGRGEELITYFGHGPDADRFGDRCGGLVGGTAQHAPASWRGDSAQIGTQRGAQRGAQTGAQTDAGRRARRVTGPSTTASTLSRAVILDRLVQRTESAYEREMRMLGHLTQGQALEASCWHRLAYHAYREYGACRPRLALSVDSTTGTVAATVQVPGPQARVPIFTVQLAPTSVYRFVTTLRRHGLDWQGPPIHATALQPLLRIHPRSAGGAVIEPVVRLGGPNSDGDSDGNSDGDSDGNSDGNSDGDPDGDSDGDPDGNSDGDSDGNSDGDSDGNSDGDSDGGSERIAALENRFRYRDLAFVPELAALVELEAPGPVAARLGLVEPTEFSRAEMPELLAAMVEADAEAQPGTTGEVIGLNLVRHFDRIEIDSRAIERDWCWLAVDYGTGSGHIGLAEILRSRRAGQRFVETAAGWVDCHAEALAPVVRMLERRQEAAEAVATESGLRLSRLELMRLSVASAEDVTIRCAGQSARAIEQILHLTPARPLAPLRGLSSTLRDYQTHGVAWLLFLFDNRFGGLLCDDMGLGKTHQIMAFMLALREQRAVTGPFLVVCPTTVLGHWQRILATHAPTLVSAVFHGGARDLTAALGDADVLLTSYGILRNDIADLEQIGFALAVFDEAQLLKNPSTRAYRAAVRIAADMRVGLSGTPIENSLMDLKALFDLTVPGYLDTDEWFRRHFAEPIERARNDRAQKALKRLIAPFTLRRVKKTVLEQLPPKIEDLRLCKLADDQVKLYRDAIAARGRALIATLEDSEQRVPYMHIFALLTVLKQICCHPALVVEGAESSYAQYESGKWELCKELVRECLASEQKVVIYSQFRGMIRIFEHYFRECGIGFATLTGATRKRSAVITRFHEDPSCRVFLGSLKAGGVGIDLVAASVVIHYDRWWNAASEDQATDRVHRMGQTRGVHVLKLVTEGTLEEKIAAIIDRRRELMRRVVSADEGNVVKSFSRAELIEILNLDATNPLRARDRVADSES